MNAPAVAGGAEPHGGAIVADAIRAHGVTTLFTLIGGHVSPILTAAEARGIAVVDVRDEATAAFAADAYARLSGVPGVAVVTAGPGLTNVITALKNAQLAQSPLVLIGGATATILKGRGALQDIDQRALVTPHVKWAAFVTRVRDLGPAVDRAFREARSGVPGPVFVECPVDLLYPEPVVREMFLAGMKAPRSFGERVVQWYLRRHLSRVFAGSRATAAATPAPPRPMHLSPLSLEPIRRAITASRRPVAVVGSQAVAAGADPRSVARALGTLGVPVYLSGMARGLLGADHPLQFRHKRREALREADLVLLCGTPCDFRLDYGRHIGGRATLVAINLSRDDATRNRRPTIATIAPPDRVLTALAEQMPAQPDRASWFSMLRSREALRDGEIAERAAMVTAAGTLNPLAVCRAIDRLLPDDAILVADGGDFVATASYTVRPRGALSWLDPGVFGTLGVGAGFVLGAHAARPSAPLVAVYGDGAFGFSLADIDTWVKQRVPVVAIVGNDGRWAQIARDQVALLGSAVGTVLGRTAYHAVADGLGALGLVVTDPASLDDALAQALAVARTGRPVVVNVHIGETDFRQGSMSL